MCRLVGHKISGCRSFCHRLKRRLRYEKVSGSRVVRDGCRRAVDCERGRNCVVVQGLTQKGRADLFHFVSVPLRGAHDERIAG